jgi:hypothetical protein
MAFKPPPEILQRVMRMKAIKIENGQFSLWGIPGTINTFFSVAYFQRLLEDRIGLPQAHNIFYSMGYLQAENGTEMVMKRFGYADSIPDRKKLMEFNSGQAEMTGLGQIEFVREDFKNNIFILKVSSGFAREYKRVFGMQKYCVDAYLRGSIDGGISPVVGTEMFTVETQCIVQGKPYCEFLMKPLKSWEKSDKFFKAQYVKREKTLKELGAKIESNVMPETS